MAQAAPRAPKTNGVGFTCTCSPNTPFPWAFLTDPLMANPISLVHTLFFRSSDPTCSFVFTCVPAAQNAVAV
ncbi:MAG TPA: hypothetical protein VHC69_21275 [Polyangiaceae bacterium]|nr:hypothetical protein [Polyangiaceae bacterium]